MTDSNNRSPGLFRNGAFLRLWGIGALYGTVRWLEVLGVGIFVFDQTRSPFAVAMVMVLRMAPMVLFGSFVGVYAERLNRKIVLTVGLATMSALATGMFLLASSGHLQVWHLMVAVFLSGMFFTTDFPVRRTLVSEAAGLENTGRAMSLDSATNNATRMLGPLLGGVVYQTIGIEGAYGIGIVVYLCAALLACGIVAKRREVAIERVAIIETIKDAIAYTKRSADLRATLAVTVIINVWAFPFTTMVPVIGRAEFHLSATEIGLLASAEGSGALLGALLLSWLVRPVHYKHVYVGGSILFVCCIALFSMSSSLVPAWILLFIAGFGIAGFAAMQSTLTIAFSSNEYRSRMMGLLAVSIGTGPLGILHLGLLAELTQASTAVYIMALEGIVAMTWLALAWVVRKS